MVHIPLGYLRPHTDVPQHLKKLLLPGRRIESKTLTEFN